MSRLTLEKKGSAMATLSPMITPLPGAKLYKLTAMHFEFLSVRQNVLKIKIECDRKQILEPKFHSSLTTSLYSNETFWHRVL